MKHWFRNVCIATALLQAVYHAVRVLVSYRVLALGGDAVTIGIVTALFSLAPLLVAVRIGRAVDRRHAAAVLRTGVLLTALGVLVIAASGDLIVLALGNVVLGFGQILVTVAGQGFITLLSPPGELDRGFAGLTLGVSVGQAIGVPLVGLIAAGSSDGGVVETTLALTVMGVVSLAAIPFAWPIRERPQSSGAAVARRPAVRVQHDLDDGDAAGRVQQSDRAGVGRRRRRVPPRPRARVRFQRSAGDVAADRADRGVDRVARVPAVAAHPGVAAEDC